MNEQEQASQHDVVIKSMDCGAIYLGLKLHCTTY